MSRVRFALPVAAALASLIAVSAVADPTISSYSVTPAGTDPGSIVSGPNGDLWFTERRADALGYSTPGGVVGQRTGLGSPGYDLATDSAGDLWITEPSAGVIARLTPAGALSNFLVETSGDDKSAAAPLEITAGPDGNMWFTADASNKSAIGKITPAGVVTLYTHGLNPNGYPLAIAAGPDGNVWFTEWAKNLIGKITPTGTVTEYALPPGATQPDSITAGPDGNLWFTAFGGPGAVGRITPAGTVTLFTAGLPAGSQPTSITAGPNGNLWFTESGGPAAPAPGATAPAAPAPAKAAPAPPAPAPAAPAPATAAIGTITPAGTITQYSTGVAAGSVPTDITTGPDGNLWFTEAANPGSIGRILLVSSATAPAPTSTPTPSTNPPSISAPKVSLPTLGRTAVAAAVSGEVEVAGPSGKFEPLSARADIAVGDVIDTSAGVVSITTRLRTARHHSLYQTARAWGGVFRLEQSRQRSLTTFKLVGASGCGSSQRASHVLGHARPSSKKKPVKRILWARDNHGQYTTHGQNSVATVRGTEWETIESCVGTTTYVKRGVVAVKNLHTGHTVLVHAGHRYLARR